MCCRFYEKCTVLQMDKKLLYFVLSVKSPKRGKIKRVSWTTPERHAVRRYFIKNLTEGTLPPLSLCTDIISIEPALKFRNPVQLKAYINNLKQKQNRHL